MDSEVEITEIHDMNVTRQDAVVTPASGFKWLITKSAAADPEKENPVVEDATKDAPVEPTESAPEETSEVTEEVTKTSDEAPAASTLTAESVAELIKAALAERESSSEELLKSAIAEVETLKNELNVLKATPIPGGPVIAATAVQQDTRAKRESLEKAAYWQRLSETVGDPDLQVEYMKRSKTAAAEAA